MSGAYLIIGAQWGDEGKGLISAYISKRENAKFVARAGTGANAEHGIFLKDERIYLKVNQLPLGWMFSPHVQIRIGSGVAVDPQKLKLEIERYHLKDRVKVDYRCPIISPEHIEAEQQSKGMTAIGSTFSGTGYCRADFALRKAKQARELDSLREILTDTSVDLNTACKTDNVVIESSQGTYLSLALSPDYPNVTSDNVTAMAAADDVLLNWKYIREVVLVVKALPTREGAGKMGNVPELSLEEIERKGFVEPSSIGGVTRRKASGLDWDMLRYAVEVNGATQIALTFCDHYDPEMKNVKDKSRITTRVRGLMEEIEKETSIPVRILNTGKAYDNIIDMDCDSVNWQGIDQSMNELSSFAQISG